MGSCMLCAVHAHPSRRSSAALALHACCSPSWGPPEQRTQAQDISRAAHQSSPAGMQHRAVSLRTEELSVVVLREDALRVCGCTCVAIYQLQAFY